MQAFVGRATNARPDSSKFPFARPLRQPPSADGAINLDKQARPTHDCTMCGRFIDPNLRNTETELSELKINPIPRRYNVKPTQDILILAKPEREPMMARWWLVPSWHKGDLKDWKATTFNARIEEAAKKPTFRAVWKHGRCLIPAGGYYEWTGEKGAKQPHFIRSAGNAETLWFAGLASRWGPRPSAFPAEPESARGELLTCAILTRAANDDVRAVHHRMPVILNGDERDRWLAGESGEDLGADARLRHHPVARFGAGDDGPELIDPI